MHTNKTLFTVIKIFITKTENNNNVSINNI